MGSGSLEGLWSHLEMCSASWPNSNIVSAESRDTCARLESKQEAVGCVCLQAHRVHGEQNMKKKRQPSNGNSYLMEMNTKQSFLCLCLCVFDLSFPFLPSKQFYVFSYLSSLLMQLSTEKCTVLLPCSMHETSLSCALLMQFL